MFVLIFARCVTTIKNDKKETEVRLIIKNLSCASFIILTRNLSISALNHMEEIRSIHMVKQSA